MESSSARGEGPERVLKEEAPIAVPTRRAAAVASDRPAVGGRPLFFGLLAVVVALGCVASLRLGGTEALGRAAAGLLIGAGIPLLGHLLRRRARTAKGHQVVAAMMPAALPSFGLLLALALPGPV